MMRIKLFSSLLFVLFASQVAVAQIVVTADGTLYDISSASTTTTFRSFLDSGDSYCCELYALDTASALGIDDTIADTDGTQYTGELRGAITPRMPVNGSSDTDATDNRICFTPSTSRTYIFDIEEAKTGGENIKVRCQNTTLIGNYNTNATPFNFLECTNLTESTVSASVFAINSSGTTVIDGTASANQYSFTAGQRRDIDIHTAAGSNQFGSVWLTNNAPRGGLDCRLSQYATGLDYRGTNRLVPKGN